MNDDYKDAPTHGAWIIKFLTYVTAASIVGALALLGWYLWTMFA